VSNLANHQGLTKGEPEQAGVSQQGYLKPGIVQRQRRFFVKSPQLLARLRVQEHVNNIHPPMNRDTTPPDDPWETDPVWKLLDQSPPLTGNARFTDDVVRAARLADSVTPWWTRIFSPAPLAGLTAATAALAFALISLVGPESQPDIQVSLKDSPQAGAIQDAVETEMLIVAVDHLDDFSDQELVSLIGF
jgi:hypothetical protein